MRTQNRLSSSVLLKRSAGRLALPLHNRLDIGSGFTPPATPPVAGYYDWFASRQVLTGSPFNPSDGSSFSEWDSLSGSGDTLAANNTPPVYHLNSLNGTLPTVTFDGAGYMLNGLPTISGAFTFFWVGKLNANGSGGTPAGILSIGSPTGLGQGITLAENGGTYQVFGNDGTTVYGPAFSSNLSWGINCLSYDGTWLRMWINGSLVMAVKVTLSIPFLDIYLAFGFGSIDSALCSFFELDVYTTALSIANINALGTWYSGTGTGAPTTGLTWDTNSIKYLSPIVQLQAWDGVNSGVTCGLWKDAAMTQPCTTEGDLIYEWQDLLSGVIIPQSYSQSTSTARPTLHFISGKPRVALSAGSPFQGMTGPVTFATPCSVALCEQIVTPGFPLRTIQGAISNWLISCARSNSDQIYNNGDIVSQGSAFGSGTAVLTLGTQSNGYFNGTKLTENTLLVVPLGGMGIGASGNTTNEPAGTNIVGIAGFQSELTQDQINVVSAYLNLL